MSSTAEGKEISEVEERVKRIETHKGVKGIMIVNPQGQFVKSTITDDKEMRLYGYNLKEVANYARDLV